MDLETAREALALLRRQEDFAWVSIIESRGSSPRHPGAHLLVRAGGASVGTVGGGPLEHQAILTAADVLETREPQLMPYHLTNDDAAGLGMICGGAGLLLVDFVDHRDATMAALFEAVSHLLEQGRRASLVTLLPADPQPGWRAHRCLVEETERTVVGSDLCASLGADALLAEGALSTTTDGERFQAHVEPLATRGTVFVFGAGHCGRSLVPFLHAVGFRTVVVDDREEYANRERFPLADAVVVPESFAGAVANLPIDEDSYVVILTRGHLHDRIVLQEALRTKARYLGMIGSRRKVAQTMDTLRAEGIDAARLEEVYAPIGVSIGAETPEEIAVSITAQLIQVRAGTTG